jgi:hypothetical protein
MPRTTKILVNYTNFLRKDTIDKLSIIVIHNLPWISSANQTTTYLEPLHSRMQEATLRRRNLGGILINQHYYQAIN